jgi:hypothetical protein
VDIEFLYGKECKRDRKEGEAGRETGREAGRETGRERQRQGCIYRQIGRNRQSHTQA